MRNEGLRVKSFLFLIPHPSFLIFLLFPVFIIPAQEGSPAGTIRWYRSNSSGMTLEHVSSRAAALRNEFCLSVQVIFPGELPRLLVSHYDYSYQIEHRSLYENGEEIRRQWIFRDANGMVRVSASGSGGLFDGDISSGDAEERTGSGFIEIRNGEGSIVKERRFDEDHAEWEFRFAYNGNTLLNSEIWFKEAPVAGEEENSEEPAGNESAGDFIPVVTDYYRYSRNGSLRAIDRVLHEGTPNYPRTAGRIAFPRPGTGASSEEENINYIVAYSSFFLLNDDNPEGANISYTLDDRGRILTEVWKNEDGRVLGEFTNTWSDDRLLSVLWKSEDDERRVEFEYDSGGNRIMARNFRRDELERSVTLRDGRETEEIYMNGRLILRAIWEDSVKISEERVNR